jgi:ComF family protein
MIFRELSIFSKRWAIQSPNAMAALVETDCVLCGATGAGEVCGACDASLPRVDAACPRCALPDVGSQACGACLRHAPAFDGAVCVFAYGFPLDAMVRRFKYAGDLAIGRWLALELAARVANEPAPDAIVVPPSTRARLRERGFNQALELAKVVARQRGIVLRRDAVARSREAAVQAGLTRAGRIANLREAFTCERPMKGRDVVVVDDVVTTGATAEAMARALKAAGAARVRVWAVARTPRPGE